MAQREFMEYDVVIVGAGPSGLACAIRLRQLAAQHGNELSVCVLEKGSEVGAHILSGAVVEPRALDELIPDWRERGAGRRLMRAMGAHLRVVGCRSAMLWVLRDNPTRWFYSHLGGREAAHEAIRVGGQMVEQSAFVWDPIEALLAATAPAQEQ